MSGQRVDLETWDRAAAYRLFRGYERPHWALTTRVDVTRLVAARADGVSPFRVCIRAVGAGINAVPELRMRLDGDGVTLFDRIDLSMTVPKDDGSFGYGYVGWDPDPARFDAACAAAVAAARAGDLAPNTGARADLAYLSCLPWLDFTHLDNALPGPGDSIPRIAWGRFVRDPGGDRWTMALSVQVHHALADGRHVADGVAAMQAALDAV